MSEAPKKSDQRVRRVFLRPGGDVKLGDIRRFVAAECDDLDDDNDVQIHEPWHGPGRDRDDPYWFKAIEVKQYDKYEQANR
jgi:hypothetical protein